MTAPRGAPSVLLITDPRWPLARIEEVIEVAGAALAPGAFAVQLRDKAASRADLARSARALRAVTARVGARLVVNAPTIEALDIAADAGADGAHVPCLADRIAGARERLGAAAWISTPAHTDDGVRVARSAGATMVLVSPIFASPGKGAPRGVDALTRARACASAGVTVAFAGALTASPAGAATAAPADALVVLALGGVDASRVAACADAGAHGVAVIRALLDAEDAASTARALDAPFQRRASPASRG
ncbi:MAG: thiamine phosphate synthase [Labilithrix sp.]|nr:thiamine phosphate synthase [Labilithrix sp.]